MIIGITGGIGAGKSVVTEYLLSKGYSVIDADEVAREAVLPGEPALAALARAFGCGILRPDGALDRTALAALAFADESGTQKLNAILHADIIDRIDAQLACVESTGDTGYGDTTSDIGHGDIVSDVGYGDLSSCSGHGDFVSDVGHGDPVSGFGVGAPGACPVFLS
ncbi:MAG: dephospho-CoA kinase, partial [Clostridiales Family XIII bacterium]|nr:dephospho-CoA kinase [Clostridiales Family XIII bacterium]